MIQVATRYPLDIENEYCSPPDQCRDIDVLVIGSAIGLTSLSYLLEQARLQLDCALRAAVVDAGPMDMLTHLAHTKFPRMAILRSGTERVGGKLSLWGVSTPRPNDALLHRWPYPSVDLIQRFESMEAEMGVPDPIPYSGAYLDLHLSDLLQELFPSEVVRNAPLAINRDGKRWCPLDKVPELIRKGAHLISRFRVTHLDMDDGLVTAVRGEWFDGRVWSLRPRVVVLSVGVEQSLSLMRQVCRAPNQVETADHIRIDLHGSLASDHFGSENAEDLGVAVLLMECKSRSRMIPYHLEIKVAPRELWARGYMPSGDNLHAAISDKSIWVQIQAIAAMHDRFPAMDLLNVESAIPPVMSSRDASFHGEIIAMMQRVAAAIRLPNPTFSLRPLLTNHHAYGAFRVGKAVTKEFRLRGTRNLYVLPPSAYVDIDDDANPTLKSCVLAQYAMDDILYRFANQGFPNPNDREFALCS